MLKLCKSEKQQNHKQSYCGDNAKIFKNKILSVYHYALLKYLMS